MQKPLASKGTRGSSKRHSFQLSLNCKQPLLGSRVAGEKQCGLPWGAGNADVSGSKGPETGRCNSMTLPLPPTPKSNGGQRCISDRENPEVSRLPAQGRNLALAVCVWSCPPMAFLMVQVQGRESAMDTHINSLV